MKFAARMIYHAAKNTHQKRTKKAASPTAYGEKKGMIFLESIPQDKEKEKPKIPPWFRVHALSLRLVERIAPEKIGRALLSAFRYFEGGGVNVPAFDDSEEGFAFQCFKLGMDDSLKNYAASVRGGINSAKKRTAKKNTNTLEGT